MKKNTPFSLINKYTITFVVALVWVLFFDKNDIFSQVKLTNELRDLETDKRYYLLEIGKNKSDINDLQTNAASLEKFAREKYLMKKDNEDVFIIVGKGEQETTEPTQ